jgi:hypothetical protein
LGILPGNTVSNNQVTRASCPWFQYFLQPRKSGILPDSFYSMNQFDFYRRKLPHWQPSGAEYFITFPLKEIAGQDVRPTNM